MSEETPQPTQVICLVISANLHEKLRFISNRSAFSENATLPSAFGDVKQVVKEILDATAAYPAWRVDDQEEQLASSRCIANRLASTDMPSRSWGDKVSNPTIYEGNRNTLEGFVTQLCLKLFSDPTCFPTPAI